MRKMTILWVPFFFVLGIFCARAADPGQAQKDQESLQHEVTVTLKLIQVLVEDKDGKPVSDLGKSDFELWDNGEPKTITDFEIHALALPQKQVEEVKLHPAAVAPKLNRTFIFILDIERNDLVGVFKAKKAAIHFIETQLQPTDEVAIFSYSRIRGLVLNKYLTLDHQTLKESIHGIREIPGRGAGGEGIPVARDILEEADQVEQEKAEERTAFNTFAYEMKQLTKYLAYLPGYKNVIFFSAGISRSLLNDQEDSSVRDNFQDMSKEFGVASSRVYAINTAGTRGYLKKPEERGGDSLKILSDFSGGKYFSNVDRYQEIGQDIQKITCNYYVLGYYIDERWDGKFHEIKVKVKRKGCKVTAQGGYFNPKPFLDLSTAEKKLQLIALALSDRPRLQEPQDFPLLVLTISLQPRNNTVFLSELWAKNLEEIGGRKTEITYFILDSQRNIINLKGGEADFSSFSQKALYHYSIASLEPGTYECRVVLRNLETGRTAVGSARVTVPRKIMSGLYLFSPLLLLPLQEREAFYARLSKPKEKKSDAISLKDIYPFVSNKAAPLIEECKTGTSMIFAVIRCLVQGIARPEIRLSARLREQSSLEEIRLSFSLLSSQKRKDLEIILAELKFPPLRVGDYILDFVIKEAKTKSKSEFSRELKVR